MSYDLRLGVKVEGTDIIAVIGQVDYNAKNPGFNRTAI